MLVYLRLVLARYGFGDDFVLLLSDKSLERAYLIDGRPLFALAQYLVHRPMAELGQLSYLRGVSSLATGLIAVFFFWQTRRFGGGLIERVSFAIALGLLPSLHVYVAQANFWLATCMSVVTLAAFALMTHIVFAEDLCRWKRMRGWIVAQAMLLLASAAYQPVLSWYWVGVFVLLLDPSFLSDAKFRKRVWWMIGLGCLAFVLCFIAFKSYFVIFDSVSKERTQLTTDPLFKLYWFARIQLPLSLNHWHLMEVGKRMASLSVAGFVGVFILSGLFQSAKHAPRSRSTSTRKVWWIRVGLLAFVGMLTHTHWLVIADVPQSYRVIAPLGVTVWIATYWAMTQWLGSEPRRPILRWGLAATALIAIAVSYHHSVSYWIRPHSRAMEFMTQVIRSDVSLETQHVHVIRQGRFDGSIEPVFIECFGSPATERAWMVREYTAFALKEVGFDPQTIVITHGTGLHPDADVTIDMRKVADWRR